MSTISSVGTAVPAYRVQQRRAQEFCRALFKEPFADIDRLLPVFDNSLIDERYFSVPPEWFEEDHSFEEKNNLYIKTALEVGAAAIRDCLEQAALRPEDIDHLFFVSTAGLATPGIDARLVNLLKMRTDIRRTPIWGLGCAGGAAGLSRAYEYTRAFPGRRALLLALELCGLTFQRNDLSKSNLIATSLFADGVARAFLEYTYSYDPRPKAGVQRPISLYPPSELCSRRPGSTYDCHACGAYITAVVFSLLNALVLRVRIREEEAAIRASGAAELERLPRFIPSVRGSAK